MHPLHGSSDQQQHAAHIDEHHGGDTMEGKQNAPDATGNQGNPDSTEGYTPFRIDTSKPPVDAERMTLFYIDDRAYTGPKQISGRAALEAIRMTVTHGPAAAAYFAMEQAIGEQAINDLLACDQLTLEQARGFLTQLSAMYYGQAMELSGK